MKKMLILFFLMSGYLAAKADVFVTNFTSCTFVIGMTGPGYVTVPPGMMVIPSSDLIDVVKNAYWPGFPVGAPLDEGFLTISSSNVLSSCSGSSTFTYNFVSGVNTSLMIL